jgi:hypothetical protein
MYFKAVLSCSPSAGRGCVVLLLHNSDCELSFARLGDKVWTWIGGGEDWFDYGYRDAMYNDKDSLFYVLGCAGDIITLDLMGTSPVVKRITKDVTNNDDLTKYLIMAPWGDLLQIWRMTDIRSSTMSVQVPEGLDSDVQDPHHELYTKEIQLHKVDLKNQEILRITSLGEYALFLGLNSAMIRSTKDFPMLKADCAYLAHDHNDDILIHTYNPKEIRVWNFRSGALEDVDNVHSWRSWPVPIWITPSLC